MPLDNIDLQAECEGQALKRLNRLAVRPPNGQHIHRKTVFCTHKKKLVLIPKRGKS